MKGKKKKKKETDEEKKIRHEKEDNDNIYAPLHFEEITETPETKLNDKEKKQIEYPKSIRDMQGLDDEEAKNTHFDDANDDLDFDWMTK